tara:strand:- start:45 stop:1241 length:1197 start_codon:yes stop_codon:yes gene_type:complete
MHLIYLRNTRLSFLKNSINFWPHREIIEAVNNYSPNLNSVIAVLPDTREINTFNFASESELQNKKVDIRQIISNENSFKDDLKRFNWFLIKNGDQGIMSNKAKLKLSKYIEKSSLFEIFNSWLAPDSSKIKLYKRKKMNETIKIINDNFSGSQLKLYFNKNAVTLNLRGNEKFLSNSFILINAKNNQESYEINIALPEIINLSRKNIDLIKNINIKNAINIDESFEFNIILLSKESEKLPISIYNVNHSRNINNSYDEFEINKIEEVEKMVKFLRNREFDKLFNLVGLVNQSNPDQEYLKDAEAIFKYRYELDKSNVDYLYNIAISQLLQKKTSEASKILLEIQKVDSNNPNLFLAKSIVDIYNLKPRQAEKNIIIAKKLNTNETLENTLKRLILFRI